MQITSPVSLWKIKIVLFAFYTSVLGFEKNMASLWANFGLTVTSPEGAHGVELVLEPMLPACPPIKSTLRRRHSGNGFHDKDIAAEFEKLKSLGVTVVVSRRTWGPSPSCF